LLPDTEALSLVVVPPPTLTASPSTTPLSRTDTLPAHGRGASLHAAQDLDVPADGHHVTVDHLVGADDDVLAEAHQVVAVVRRLGRSGASGASGGSGHVDVLIRAVRDLHPRRLGHGGALPSSMTRTEIPSLSAAALDAFAASAFEAPNASGPGGRAPQGAARGTKPQRSMEKASTAPSCQTTGKHGPHSLRGDGMVAA